MNEREKIKAKFGGRCAYCGCELNGKWHVDHMEPVYRISVTMQWPERDVYENKVPACVPCNNYKNVWSIDEFRLQVYLQIRRCRDYSINFRTAERFGLVSVTEKPIVFWFEQYLQSSPINDNKIPIGE